MYEVYIENSAQRDLKKLSVDDFYRIISHIKNLAENPRPSGCRKLVDSKGDWRIRIGDYRVIYEIDDKEKLINIMPVKRGPKAYRNL